MKYTIIVVTGIILFFCGCIRDDIQERFNATATSFPPQYGTGEDGDITIKNGYTVNITELYENDSVNGVITKNGANKGLNHGLNSYDPANGYYVKSTSVVIEAGSVLTANAWDTGIDNRKGILWIACTGSFVNNGSIDMKGKGASGGTRGCATDGNNGNGNSTGYGRKGLRSGPGGSCGFTYGDTSITGGIWNYLYGSGGGGGSGACEGGSTCYGAGGGGAGHVNNGLYGGNGNGGSCGSCSPSRCGSDGGAGGGSVRIFAVFFDTSNGTINCDGLNGGNWGYNSGGGGGGSGGTVYIETIDGKAGINKISCAGGLGGTYTGAGGSGGADGGNGSIGRIHITGTYTGTTNNPVIE